MLEKAQLGAGGHMVGLGLSDAQAEAFVIAHATGEKSDLDVLAQQTVTNMSPDARAALDAKYELEPDNPDLTAKRLKEILKTKAMDGLRIAFASTNDRAEKKKVLVAAIAAIKNMASDKGFTLTFEPEDVLAFLSKAPTPSPKFVNPDDVIKIVGRKMVKDTRAQGNPTPTPDGPPNVASAPDVSPMPRRSDGPRGNHHGHPAQDQMGQVQADLQDQNGQIRHR